MATSQSTGPLRVLDVATVDPDPIQQFVKWFDEAQASDMLEPTAMTLATSTSDGRPTARIVLLKGVDQEGFTFFTNYDSRKGIELAACSDVALVFWWALHERQVRVEGRAHKIEAQESDAYFQSRPLGSRLGAWASPQSRPIDSRRILEQRLEAATSRFEGKEVERPPHWGGYRVVPTLVEFWQGRPSRLHDRVQYLREGDGRWEIVRLAP